MGPLQTMNKQNLKKLYIHLKILSLFQLLKLLYEGFQLPRFLTKCHGDSQDSKNGRWPDYISLLKSRVVLRPLRPWIRPCSFHVVSSYMCENSERGVSYLHPYLLLWCR